jgi:hypothetical protein
MDNVVKFPEGEYLINEAGMLLLAMKADTAPGKRIRGEIIEIVKAWQRGQMLPRVQTPMLRKIYGDLPFKQRP